MEDVFEEVKRKYSLKGIKLDVEFVKEAECYRLTLNSKQVIIPQSLLISSKDDVMEYIVLTLQK